MGMTKIMKMLFPLRSLSVSLQKQVGCFNHRVVALVADKLERQWPVEVCFDVED